MIEEKVGPVADRMIEQRIDSRLQPIEQRITLMTRISDCETQIRFNSRDAYEELVRIVQNTRDPEVIRYGKKALDSINKNYDAAWQPTPSWKQKPLDFMKSLMIGNLKQPPSNLHDVVSVINDESDLSLVALGFIVFRDLTGEKVRMFDFAAVKSWCASHQPKCTQ
jgi:hypothetical protein